MAVTTAGEHVPVPLCIRCYEEAFCPEGWSKLLGFHPKTPGRGPWRDTSDACFDGEFQFTILALGARTLPRMRGPILKLRRPVEAILEEAPLCGLCRILCDLDTAGRLTTGRYQNAEVDLQLFFPEKRGSDTWHSFVIQVALTLESKKAKKFTNKKLLAIVRLCSPGSTKVSDIEQGNRTMEIL